MGRLPGLRACGFGDPARSAGAAGVTARSASSSVLSAQVADTSVSSALVSHGSVSYPVFVFIDLCLHLRATYSLLCFTLEEVWQVDDRMERHQEDQEALLRHVVFTDQETVTHLSSSYSRAPPA